jgi:hypothetical protein
MVNSPQVSAVVVASASGSRNESGVWHSEQCHAMCRALETYPKSARLAFDLDEYLRLTRTWQQEADRYRAAKPTVDFPFPGGRRAQRAYFDACRDLLAPDFGLCVLRVAAPERDATLAFARFREATGLKTAA